MNKFLTILAMLIALGGSGGYTGEQGGDAVNKETTEITTSTEATGECFTDKMYSQMPKDKNYMFSPYSVKSALAMAANGASGETREEITEALGIENLEEFNIRSAEAIKKYTATELLRLNISNSIWINKDVFDGDFSDEYKENVTQYYDGEVGYVTKSNALPTINGWVNEKTSGKIPSIITSPDFDAALINAIYFKAKWKDEFSASLTEKGKFTDRGGKETEIDFMNAERKMPYAEIDGVKAVRLDYMTRGTVPSSDGQQNGNTDVRLDGVNVSMYLLLSENDITEPEKIVKKLISDNLFETRKVKLSMPKFKIEYSAELNDALRAIGIRSAFSDADFSKMFNADKNMAVSSVLHKTFIEVDEKGTEAAAVTALILMGTAMPRPEEVVDFKADKPFTFLVMDNISGETFFIGEYAFAE